MFKPKSAFSGFSVNDLAKAKRFYSDTLGLTVEADGIGLRLQPAPGYPVFVYPKEDHQPATFTVLNLVVDRIDEAMDVLKSKGVTFEHYRSDDMPQDEKGILRGLSHDMGPDIAWFKDPAGNVLAILQEEK